MNMILSLILIFIFLAQLSLTNTTLKFKKSQTEIITKYPGQVKVGSSLSSTCRPDAPCSLMEDVTIGLSSNYIEEYLLSPNEKYKFINQQDGNLVVYNLEKNKAIWSSGSTKNGFNFSSSPAYFMVQPDGNLVLYDKYGNVQWSSGSNGKGEFPFSLKMQDDGNLVLYDAVSKPIWSSNTQNQ